MEIACSFSLSPPMLCMVLLVLLFSSFSSFFVGMAKASCSSGSCQLREGCVSTSDCTDGLFCSACVAQNEVQRCHRYQIANPVVVARNGLPFNKYSWLTTHNSFAITGSPSQTGTPIVTLLNQEDSVTDQLKNGVRGLMLDMYDFRGDVWLCHSFGGVCYDATAFRPAIDTLKEIEAFLSANPVEIITIFIEDYVHAANGVTKVLEASGLMKYLFPVSRMPKNGEDWPTVTDMVADNQRLLVFTSSRTKEASEGIAYEWGYVAENQYGDDGMKVGSCTKRTESVSLDSKSRSLILVNFFPTNPLEAETCKYNSAMLQQMQTVCYQAAGKRWPNYVAVDFYKRSDGGGVFEAMDTLNAGLICGCPDLASCKMKQPFGVCNYSPEGSKSASNVPNTTSSSSSSSPVTSSLPLTSSPSSSSSSSLSSSSSSSSPSSSRKTLKILFGEIIAALLLFLLVN